MVKFLALSVKIIYHISLLFVLNFLYCTVNELYEDLKIEIEFWRELIDQSDLSLSSLEYLRMQRALQLARRKLSDYEQIRVQPMANSIMH